MVAIMNNQYKWLLCKFKFAFINRLFCLWIDGILKFNICPFPIINFQIDSLRSLTNSWMLINLLYQSPINIIQVKQDFISITLINLVQNWLNCNRKQRAFRESPVVPLTGLYLTMWRSVEMLHWLRTVDRETQMHFYCQEWLQRVLIFQDIIVIWL